ncbi:hypothetical protein [Pseudomonas sp. NPDC087639]|uniref:hypothetical protein n=1 Tax=Pseudomonas sp. NPDC087639 TaxID=3364445 RepID=UPI0038182416
MNYAVLYEFKDIKGDHHAEAIISRYNDGYAPGSKPNVVVTVEYNTVSKKYETVEGYDDVEGDGDLDEDDQSYYTLAADIASAIAGLSKQDDGRRYKSMLVSFDNNGSPAAPPDVKIGLFNVSNPGLSQPDFTVTATDYRNGLYNKVSNTVDANGDNRIDLNDQLVFKRIANSFASMKGFKA